MPTLGTTYNNKSNLGSTGDAAHATGRTTDDHSDSSRGNGVTKCVNKGHENDHDSDTDNENEGQEDQMSFEEFNRHFYFDVQKAQYVPKHRENPDLVIPGLYLGDQINAYDRQTLSRFNITHVLSVAVITNMEAHVRAFPSGVVLDAMTLPDEVGADITCYFHRAIDFIDQALQRGSVLVHCVWGMSRSPTIVIAYLMQRKGMSFWAALRYLKHVRPIVSPNSGFKQQLIAFGKTLACQRAAEAAVASSAKAIAGRLASKAASETTTSASISTSTRAEEEKLVEFSVHYVTRYGQDLHIVGSSDALGTWKATEGNKMHWTEGGMWKARLPLKGKQVEYKYVVVDHEEAESNVHWESCTNRIYDGCRSFVRDFWDCQGSSITRQNSFSFITSDTESNH
ncbi:dual specificity protein phosphatase 1 [Pelomyxa schiedti]|nr:dual specificity protein phosphatase 1 [Pelomyxa schiedti]